jgi:uncharacterized protein YndB with AHSA1/START domain
LKVIEKEGIVGAPRSKVWNAFTTEEGVKTFFAPEAKVKLELLGSYEMYFLLDNEPGKRGGEGNQVLSFIPEKMLSFSWNAPPEFPEEREQKTYVIVEFEENGVESTKVVLRHFFEREGGRWNEVYNYFVKAWDIVLGKLEESFEKGPVFKKQS